MTKKPKLLMLKGLPASGKTTYARELVEKQGYVRVNKDDLRAMLDSGKWSKDNEKRVLKIRDTIIRDALSSGKNVVVDDTNFAQTHYDSLRETAENNQANFEVIFIDTPLEDCIARNEERANKVPINVIVEMHNKYIAPLRGENEVIEYDETLDEAIIVDIDGTLAHIDRDNPRNVYDGSRALEDTLDDAVGNIVSMAYGHGYTVLIVTGRKAEHKDVTIQWLAKHGIEYDEIHSRTEEESKKNVCDVDVKERIYNEHIKGKYNVKYVIDDRPRVCRMWRRLGLKTLQVGDPHKEF